MLVIDNVVHHTGENVDNEIVIPLSKFSVTTKTKSGEPVGEVAQYEAIDEGDAIAQHIKATNVQLASSELGKGSSTLKFDVRAIEENRVDVLNPPEPVAKSIGSPKKATDIKPESPTVKKTTKKASK